LMVLVQNSFASHSADRREPPVLESKGIVKT